MAFSDYKFDLFDDPLFGLPDFVPEDARNIWNSTIGKGLDVLKLPALLSSLAALTVKQDAEAERLAREQGIVKSWEQRSDISPLLKMGIEIGMGGVADPLGAFIGPMRGVSRALTSPAAKLLRGGMDEAYRLPLVGNAFRLSNEAIKLNLEDEIGTIMSNVKTRGLDPSLFNDLMTGIKDGSLDMDTGKSLLGIGINGLTVLKENVGDMSKLLKKHAADPEKFYGGVEKQIISDLSTTQNIKNSYASPIVKTYKDVNKGVKDFLLSGGGVVAGNLSDILAKSTLSGLRTGDILADLGRGIKGISPEDILNDPIMKEIVGHGGVPKSLGIDLGTEFSGNSILQKVHPALAGGVGAALGTLGGGGMGAGLGAAEGLATKYGSSFTQGGMKLLETIARKHSFLEGIRRYFKGGSELTNSFSPIMRESSINALKNELGDTAFTALWNKLGEREFLVNPKTVYQEAINMGIPQGNAMRASIIWNDMHEEAIRSGIKLTNDINFPYTRDTNLIAFLRNLTPFPVWPARNLPYYAEQSIRQPMIPSMIASGLEKANEEDQAHNLPNRLEYKLPLAQLGNEGTVYFNPLAPASITTQLNEPLSYPPDHPPTDFEKARDLASSLGFAFNPIIGMGLQTAGLTDQGRDISDLLPWSRFFKPLSKIMGMRGYQPELALKKPLEGARRAIAPESVPDVGYEEYQLRKKIAELSLEQTGKPFWEAGNEPYMQALIDEHSPIRAEANKRLGIEGVALYGARRALPLQLGFLPSSEANIRQHMQQSKLGEGKQLSKEELVKLLQSDPTAFAYRWLSDSDPELALKIKQQQYMGLNKDSKKLFLSQNPDLQEYFTWSDKERKAKRSPSIEIYIRLKKNEINSLIP